MMELGQSDNFKLVFKRWSSQPLVVLAKYNGSWGMSSWNAAAQSLLLIILSTDGATSTIRHCSGVPCSISFRTAWQSRPLFTDFSVHPQCFTEVNLHCKAIQGLQKASQLVTILVSTTKKIAMSFPRHQFSLTMHDPGAHDYVQKIVLRDTPTLQTQYKHIPVCDAVMQYDTMKDDDVKEKAYWTLY